MLDIRAIAEMENMAKPIADKIKTFPYYIMYGRGYNLEFNWKRYLEWFGAPTAIIDRSAEPGDTFEGLELISSMANLPDEVLVNCMVVLTAPTYRDEICNETLKYVSDERIVRYPDIFNGNSPHYSKFLLKNSDSVNAFYKLLEDDGSKDIFENWLRGRVSCDISYFCKSCTPGDYVNLSCLPIEILRRAGYVSDHYYCKERGRAWPNVALFTTGVFSYSDHEILYDCGAAYGDTLKGFEQAVGGKYDSAILIELDRYVYGGLLKLAARDKRNFFINCGVSDENSEICMDVNSGLGGVSIDMLRSEGKEKCGDVLKLRTIDSLVEELGLIPTIIKMDVEGAELSALHGAEKTIKKHRPKLMICIYHKDEDIVTIPAYIKSLNADYEMSVRLFDTSASDMVLFCK